MHIQTHQFTFDGDPELLDNHQSINELLEQIIDVAQLKILKVVSHNFQPQGLSVAFVLAESHIAAHTWPEDNFGYITLSSCKIEPIDIKAIKSAITSKLGASIVNHQSLANHPEIANVR